MRHAFRTACHSRDLLLSSEAWKLQLAMQHEMSACTEGWSAERSQAQLIQTPLLCLQAWREDRTLIAASYLISEALGQRYVDGNPLSMERVLEESGTAMPVICLLSPGAVAHHPCLSA